MYPRFKNEGSKNELLIKRRKVLGGRFLLILSFLFLAKLFSLHLFEFFFFFCWKSISKMDLLFWTITLFSFAFDHVISCTFNTHTRAPTAIELLRQQRINSNNIYTCLMANASFKLMSKLPLLLLGFANWWCQSVNEINCCKI